MAKSNGRRGLPWHKFAHYLFFLGVVIAILTAFFQAVVNPRVIMTVLVGLGFVVGLFNITAKETHHFLLAAVALMLAGIVNFGLIYPSGLGDLIRTMTSNVVVFVVPGAIIVALKTIWKLASD